MSGQSLYCRMPSDWPADPSLCLFEWQTFVAAIIALIGAYLTIRQINKQIAQAETHRQDDISRRLRALRATFPLTLSEVCVFAQRLIFALQAGLHVLRNDGKGMLAEQFDCPDLGETVVRGLTDMLEAVESRRVAALIPEIIREIQVIQARVTSMENSRELESLVDPEINILDYIIQSARLHALAEALFDYARQRDDDGPVDVLWAKVQSVFDELHIYPQDNRELFKRLKLKPGGAIPTWSFRSK